MLCRIGQWRENAVAKGRKEEEEEEETVVEIGYGRLTLHLPSVIFKHFLP
jgi:hypothetical protein